MKRCVVAVVCALTAVTTLAGFAGPASADRMVHRDPRGDVVRVDVETGSQTAVQSVAQGDVIRASVAHRSRSVVLKLTFAALRRRAMHAEIAKLLTPTGEADITLWADQEVGWQGKVLFMSEPSKKDCRRLRHRIDYDRNTIRVVVPRSCLDTPRWVRAGIEAMRLTDHGAFIDDALRVGIRDDLKLSRRLYRG